MTQPGGWRCWDVVKFFQRMYAKIAIRIEGGEASTLKGRIRSAGVNDVTAICRRAGVAKGEIWVDGIERVRFSREIPEEIRQRLRNCVLDAVQR